MTELCESWGGRPKLPVPNSPYGLCGHKATLNLLRTELCESWSRCPRLPDPNSPYGLCGCKATLHLNLLRIELCENWSHRPRLPDTNSPYGLRGRKTTPNSSYDNSVYGTHLFENFVCVCMCLFSVCGDLCPVQLQLQVPAGGLFHHTTCLAGNFSFFFFPAFYAMSWQSLRKNIVVRLVAEIGSF